MARDEIFVAPPDLLSFMVQVFCGNGMSEHDATTVAEALLWANLRGHDGHGVARLPRYIEMIQKGDLDPNAQPEITSQTAATFVVNAKRAAGAVAMSVAVEEACRRAKVAGACYGLVRETTHVGAIGYYARRAANHDCAALMAACGPPFMAYHGTKVPSLSTSPIAIAVPSGASEPIVFDMATSVASMGQINQARAKGKSLLEGWVIDATGKPTTDPKAGVIPLPVGGPKGSGLSLMFELLTGVLGATPILSKAIGAEHRTRHLQNAFLVVLDINAFRPASDFRQDATELADIIKQLPLREGFEEILLPGERGEKTEVVRRKTGIPLAPAVWDALTQTAHAHSIEMPKIVPPG
jgi:ureidoglycolate dehydrogenase (NAD+)